MWQIKLKFLLFFLLSALIFNDSTSQETNYSPSDEIIKSFEKTADSLLSLLTIEEKASQMLSTSRSIPEHEIEMYNWWNEALHGVARSAKATVFPQAIAMGATEMQFVARGCPSRLECVTNRGSAYWWFNSLRV